jgi:hypothetical protein
MSAVGGRRPDAAGHPLGEIIIVFAPIEKNPLVVLAALDGRLRLFHAKGRSTRSANLQHGYKIFTRTPLA